MKKSQVVIVISVLIAGFALVSAVTVFIHPGLPHGQAKDEATLLELTLFIQDNRPYVAPEIDVVADALRRNTKWRINVTSRLYERGRNWSEWLALFAASGALPTVFVFPADGVDTVDRYSEMFVDLERYLADPQQTPHVNKWLDSRLLDSMRTFETGRLIGWPLGIGPDLRDPEIRNRYHEQYLDARTHGFYITVREDVLAALGYSFVPLSELQQMLSRDNRRLTDGDVRITPEIATIEDFEVLLRRIRDSGVVAPDGTPLIPFGGTDPTIQFGAAFGFYHFRRVNGNIEGFYGSPHAKEFFRTLNRWYREDLFDPDPIIARDHHDALAAKITAGHVAAWKSWPMDDPEGIERALEATLPEATVRYIPVPRYRSDLPAYTSALRVGAVQMAAINRNYGQVDDLVEYLDWLYSDSAQELIVWGDAESGMWHMDDGRRVITDPQLREAIRMNTLTADGQGPRYYGLPVRTGSSLFATYSSTWVHGLHRHGFNRFLDELRAPIRYDARHEAKRLAGRSMTSIDGSLMYPRGPEAGKLNNFFWSESGPHNARLLLAETDDDFEQAWADVYEAFMSAGNYDAAVSDLARWLETMGY